MLFEKFVFKGEGSVLDIKGSCSSSQLVSQVLKMELEGLVLRLVRLVCYAFILQRRGHGKFASRVIIYIREIFDIVRQGYPCEFDRDVKDVQLFMLLKKDVEGENAEVNKESMVVTEYAAYSVGCYFKKRWLKLLKEVADQETNKLKLPGLIVFKKIYNLYGDCSEYYEEKERQAMHFRVCPKPLCHSQNTRILYENTVLFVAKITKDEKMFREMLYYMLEKYQKYPMFKKRLLRMEPMILSEKTMVVVEDLK